MREPRVASTTLTSSSVASPKTSPHLRQRASITYPSQNPLTELTEISINEMILLSVDVQDVEGEFSSDCAQEVEYLFDQ